LYFIYFAMYYNLVTDVVGLIKIYEQETGTVNPDVHSFTLWLNEYHNRQGKAIVAEPEWEGKSNGRSADSVINTSLVHLYRYAKLQAKAAIAGTSFSTSDDFIYLISLVSFGSMTKTALIKLNVHEKSAGIQIVNRLIHNGLVEQTAIDSDKRNRMIHVTPKGTALLNESMENIRQASRNVTEPLSDSEKMDLIRLLNKLEHFHEQRSRGILQ
jgi:DNA-binding MarR family transcriptional regulator